MEVNWFSKAVLGSKIDLYQELRLSPGPPNLPPQSGPPSNPLLPGPGLLRALEVSGAEAGSLELFEPGFLSVVVSQLLVWAHTTP